MPTRDEALQQAMQLCQAGKKEQAARLLIHLLKNDPTSEQSWWLLAACLDDPKKQRDCLERVLMISPYHLGARMYLDRLENNQKLPDPCAEDSVAPGGARTEGRADGTTAGDAAGYAATTPFEQPLPPAPDRPEVERLLEHARAAEDRKDFIAAYGLYNRVLEQESSHLYAWLGKGYSAGRLSDENNNRIPEFFDCLTRTILARDPFGLTLHEALTRLDPLFAQAASDCLLRLAGYAAQLAISIPQPMANVYAVERVHLTDWAYAIGRQLNTQSGLWCSRAELIGVANDAFRRILQNIVETQRSARARQETVKTLRSYLLNNLATSGINKDPDFLNGLDRMVTETIYG